MLDLILLVVALVVAIVAAFIDRKNVVTLLLAGGLIALALIPLLPKLS